MVDVPRVFSPQFLEIVETSLLKLIRILDGGEYKPIQKEIKNYRLI